MSKNEFRYCAIIITIFCIIIFIIQVIFSFITENFILISIDVISRPWILITSIFLHGSLEHLMYNMLALVLFGTILEKIIGSKNFILVFLVSGILANITSIFFYEATLGASGAIFGILGCLTFLRPKMIVWVYSVPMPMIVAAAIWFLIDLVGVFYPSNIANISHISGLLIGMIFGFVLRNKYKEETNTKKEKPLNEKDLDEWEEKYMR
ncbi:MAG: rhomboid family intramembrane serine protease [Candidatus Aenigmatarchaeota archaeon]